ncbi:hypothetical protein CBR_g70731 [Chara braunii]|uniref:CCHC-type domain-containing protein n=1 Tax=Chara braunii TaxID=69332 RepID=A0A388K9U7_CHABU|nr:hypothetical protein CBR_g70731 [Chara braunii]|eukprot:GBG66854.1 hypothetical protein CBR_g70731 [Chara braunii]
MSNHERGDDNKGFGDGDRRQYRAPTCFNCHEQGHYANQCPHRDRRQYLSRPSTSTDSRRSRSPRRFEHRRYVSPPRQEAELRGKLAALSQGVAEMKKHFNAEKARKEAKERRKLDKERRKEEERRIAEEEEKRKIEEEARREEKKRKKVEKAKREAILRAEMKKELCISEKQKREADVVLEGSPPMEMPAKRTPRKVARPMLPTERLTRSKARKKVGCIMVRAKRKSQVKTPLDKVVKSGKKASPDSPPSGRITPVSKVVLRLRYRDAVMRELKDSNEDEFQRICREEGLHYEGKIDAIFDIAEYRSRRQFPEGNQAIEGIPISVSNDTEAVETPANDLE